MFYLCYNPDNIIYICLKISFVKSSSSLYLSSLLTTTLWFKSNNCVRNLVKISISNSVLEFLNCNGRYKRFSNNQSVNNNFINNFFHYGWYKNTPGSWVSVRCYRQVLIKGQNMNNTSGDLPCEYICFNASNY